MPSLHELQQGFVAAVLDGHGAAPMLAITPAADAAERIAIYRRAVFANYRNALGATFPVVARLTGTPFFNAAVDAFVHARPSRSGDLNVYGDAFADFLSNYAPAATLPYLSDVARLEWAIDEASRAGDAPRAPASVLAALAGVAPDRLPAVRVTLEPSCRLVASRYPILRLWQVNQADPEGDDRVSLDDGGQALLVRRDERGIALELLTAGERAWLEALASGAALGIAIDAAQTADAAFDLGAALRTHIATGTIASVAA